MERETGAGEKRETEMGERKIERQKREIEREREREGGRKRKNCKHKQIHRTLSCRASFRRTE